MHYKIISIIVSAILFHVLLVFGIFQQVSMQTPHVKLVRSFHKEMKNEHIKIKNLSNEIKKQPNNYILYLKRADAQIEQQEIFLDFVRIFLTYSEYNIVNKSDIIEDLKKQRSLTLILIIISHLVLLRLNLSNMILQLNILLIIFVIIKTLGNFI